MHNPKGRKGRYTERVDILGERNISESVNFALKYRCWGLLGATVPRCVKTWRQMEWYAYSRLLSLGLKRLVLADGSYAEVAREAQEHDLHRPGLFKRLCAQTADDTDEAVAA